MFRVQARLAWRPGPDLESEPERRETPVTASARFTLRLRRPLARVSHVPPGLARTAGAGGGKGSAPRRCRAQWQGRRRLLRADGGLGPGLARAALAGRVWRLTASQAQREGGGTRTTVTILGETPEKHWKNLNTDIGNHDWTMGIMGQPWWHCDSSLACGLSPRRLCPTIAQI